MIWQAWTRMWMLDCKLQVGVFLILKSKFIGVFLHMNYE